jgi:hypothetical protein
LVTAGNNVESDERRKNRVDATARMEDAGFYDKQLESNGTTEAVGRVLLSEARSRW